ncbi:MAG: PAS domain S-box protein [Alphaproteobacteria bacterium]|nr:PAS domain S-box protein [Alphaproteobacteria bacterium]
MLFQPALAPQAIASALCTLVLFAGLVTLARRGAGVPATGWWAVTILAAGSEPLTAGLAQGFAGEIGAASILHLVKIASAAAGAHSWFGRQLAGVLLAGAAGLAVLGLQLQSAAAAAALAAASAAVLLGIAGWLVGRRREGSARFPVAAGFAVLGALDFSSLVEPAMSVGGWSPAVLSPFAATLIAAGLVLFAFEKQRKSNAEDTLARRLRFALDQASIGIALYDSDDRLSFANRHFLKFYGRGDGTSVIGRRFADILADSVDASKHALKGVAAEQFIAQRLERHRDPQGPFLQKLGDGRVVEIREYRLADGSTAGTWYDVTDIKRHQDAFALAISGRAEGGDFMVVAVQALALGLGYRWTHIGRLSPGGDRIESVVAWDTNRIAGNFSYAIAGTPCGDAVTTGYCFVPDDVMSRYPADKVLAQYNARSYCGMLLRNRAGQTIGHIAALNDRPDAATADHRGFLSVMADWIATEFDRRATEVALRSSEQRVRDFAEAASEWFYEMGPDLRFTYISPRMLDATGIDPAKLIGLHRLDVVGDCSEASLKAHIDDLTRHRPFRGFQYLSKPSFGPARYLSISGKPLFDANGNFLGYRGTGRDVTRERQALADAARKSALLDTAVANMAEGILIIDQQGQLILANERARDARSAGRAGDPRPAQPHHHALPRQARRLRPS